MYIPTLHEPRARKLAAAGRTRGRFMPNCLRAYTFRNILNNDLPWYSLLGDLQGETTTALVTEQFNLAIVCTFRIRMKSATNAVIVANHFPYSTHNNERAGNNQSPCPPPSEIDRQPGRTNGGTFGVLAGLANPAEQSSLKLRGLTGSGFPTRL